MTIYNAVFRIDQTRGSGTSTGEPGISRRDLWLSNMVHLTPTSPPPDATFLWEFLDRPAGSTAVFLDETTGQQSATSKYVKFMPDVWGTYRIRLTINRGQYSQVELAAVLLSSTGGVTHRGWRLPSFKEIDTEANFPGQLRGYADDWDFILMDILENAFTGGGSTLIGYTYDSPVYSTALGSGAGVVAEGANNVFVGYHAGNQLTTGTGNSLIGSNAGAVLTTQSYNIALGNGAMQAATGGSCTSVGYQAAYYGTGSYNVGVGYQAAKGNDTTSSGHSNVAVGASSLAVYTTGAANTMVGYQTGMALTTGPSNVAIGSSSGRYITTGGANVLVGAYVGTTLTTGGSNILLGHNCNVSAAGDTYSIVVGRDVVGKGSGTTVIGVSTQTTDTWLRGDTLRVGNETATDKYFYFQNSATGAQPGLRWNNATSKLQWSHDGTTYNDFAVGGGSSLAGYTNGSPSDNTALGVGVGTPSGTDNTFIGYNAGNAATTGNSNVLVGSSAGYTLTTGGSNVLVGYNCTVSANADSGCIVIGSGATGKGSNTTVVGMFSMTTDTWLRGNTLHVGNETATDKYFYFQNSATGVQPGFKWNNATSKLQWSNDGTNYNDLIYLAGYTSEASYNTALGVGTGGSSSGLDNTLVGYQAGSSMTTGADNTFIGYLAGGSVQSSSSSVAVGSGAMGSNTGGNNTAVGAIAARYGSGSNNVAVGNSALYGTGTSTGGNNTAVGVNAGAATVDGSNNVFIGYNAAQTPTACSEAVVIGVNAGASATGSGNQIVQGVLVGAHAGENSSVPSTTSVGYEAGRYSTSTAAGSVTAFGYQAGKGVSGSTNGAQNTALGYTALKAYTIGTYNTAVGYGALSALTIAHNNTAVGVNAGVGIVNGASNTMFGAAAGRNISGGASNTCIGFQAGYAGGGGVAITSGSYNICIGDWATVAGAADTYSIVIGRDIVGKGSKTTVIGSKDATNGTTDTWLRGTALHVGNEPGTAGDALLVFENGTGAAGTRPGFKAGSDGLMYYRNAGAASWTTLDSLSDIRLKKNVEDLPYGLDFLQTLRPVLFDWRTPQGPIQARKQMGLVAQELKKACEDAGFSPGLVDDSGKYMSVRYEQLVPALIKAVQELSAKVAELEQKLKEK